MGVFGDRTEGAVWEDLRPVGTRREMVTPIRKDRGQVTKLQNRLLPALQTDMDTYWPNHIPGENVLVR